MSGPRTEAGRALLRSDFDTTGWGPRMVRERVTEGVLAIEAEARAAAEAERDALRDALGRVRTYVAGNLAAWDTGLTLRTATTAAQRLEVAYADIYRKVLRVIDGDG